MRGRATLLALLLLTPSASALSALVDVTKDDTLLVVLATPLLAEPEAPTEPPPESARAPPPGSEAARREPPSPETLVRIEDLPETPLPLRHIEVRQEDGRANSIDAGRKAERLDAAAEPRARSQPPLPGARLALEPAPRPFEIQEAPRAPETGPHARPRADDTPPAATPSAGPASANEPKSSPPWGPVAAAAGSALALLVSFLLYHRARGVSTLRNPQRERLVELLASHPGLSPATAARELGVDRSTAVYHLRRLVREGLAVCDGPPRGTRYFAPGSMTPEERARAIALRGTDDVVQAIETAPGATKTELAHRLAIARATLGWYLGRLERAGVVQCVRAGRTVRVYPTKQVLS